ncbi:MAG: hypothetical protein LBF22_04705 [Deltaproteobacteria bacterium]|jgi:hypothetical protein|nr:hypothetical protein [Deltaproteobacteria bacterium]
MEKIIVALIVIAALGFTFYKIFVRPSCSCGCGGKRKKGEKDSSLPNCPLNAGGRGELQSPEE